MASNGRSRNGETTVGGAAEVEDHVVDGTGIKQTWCSGFGLDNGLQGQERVHLPCGGFAE